MWLGEEPALQRVEEQQRAVDQDEGAEVAGRQDAREQHHRQEARQ